MDKISIFYQEITYLNGRIDSLIEEDKLIKDNFLSILDLDFFFRSNEI